MTAKKKAAARKSAPAKSDPKKSASKKSASKKPPSKKSASKLLASKTSASKKPVSKKAVQQAKPSAKKPAHSAVRGLHLRAPMLIVAGEHSGDRLGGDLIHELKQQGFRSFFGTGGERMQAEGMQLVEHVDTMAVIGFVEVLRAYSRLKALAQRLTAMAIEKKVKTVVLIDYPGFNLRIAAMLKEADPDIFIVYLVSPQIWAWKYGRIHTIRKHVDLMLTLFEFEKEIYDSEGVPAEWIGHPMVNRIPEELKRQPPVAAHRGTSLGLLPGSRRSEIRLLLPAFLEAARILKERHPHLHIRLPFVDERLREFAAPFLEGSEALGLEISVGNSLAVMEASDIIFIASGTATLEAAFFKKPMVICYRSHWLNVFIASLVMRTRFIGLPNLLAGEQVALELLQNEVTPAAIAEEGERLLKKKSERERIIRRLSEIPFAPKKKRPARLAVEYIERYLTRPDLTRAEKSVSTSRVGSSKKKVASETVK